LGIEALNRTYRCHRRARQTIRFVAPALLGTALVLALLPTADAGKPLTGAPAPQLRPEVTLVSAEATVEPASLASSAGFDVPSLRPAVASTNMGLAAPSLSGASTATYASVIVKRGDTLMSALQRGGLSAAEAARSLPKLKGKIDARRLQPGDRLILGFYSDGRGRHLAFLGWKAQKGAAVNVALRPGAAPGTGAAGNAAIASTASGGAGMAQKVIAVQGSPSLPRKLTELGLPPQVSEQVIMAMSQTRKPPVHGEILKIVYCVPSDPSSTALPQLTYAAYKGRDGKQHILRYVPVAPPPAFQDADVAPAAMVALWAPLPGARISSPFGWRIHPVFHSRMFHKGVDYEAAAGTPVMAAADGVVEDVGPRGNYGNYILVRHSGRLETAYAHLAGFAPTVQVGAPIHRGDVIGYVGMTGVATGPHLYYEVIVDGRQIDPEGPALKQATRAFSTQTARLN
jgi:murein DD-endopeptidase MepM/ murein hydrolase activator NlpD